jgi:hypothetical protein
MQLKKEKTTISRWREHPYFALHLWLLLSLPLWIASLVYVHFHPRAVGFLLISTGQALSGLYNAAGKKRATLTKIFLTFGTIFLLLAILASRFFPDQWGFGFLTGGSCLIAAACVNALLPSLKS